MEYKNINYKIYLNKSDESGRCSVILYDSNSINDNSDPMDLAKDKYICKIEFDSNTGITNSLVYGINPNSNNENYSSEDVRKIINHYKYVGSHKDEGRLPLLAYISSVVDNKEEYLAGNSKLRFIIPCYATVGEESDYINANKEMSEKVNILFNNIKQSNTKPHFICLPYSAYVIEAHGERHVVSIIFFPIKDKVVYYDSGDSFRKNSDGLVDDASKIFGVLVEKMKTEKQLEKLKVPEESTKDKDKQSNDSEDFGEDWSGMELDDNDIFFTESTNNNIENVVFEVAPINSKLSIENKFPQKTDQTSDCSYRVEAFNKTLTTSLLTKNIGSLEELLDIFGNKEKCNSFFKEVDANLTLIKDTQYERHIESKSSDCCLITQPSPSPETKEKASEIKQQLDSESRQQDLHSGVGGGII